LWVILITAIQLLKYNNKNAQNPAADNLYEAETMAGSAGSDRMQITCTSLQIDNHSSIEHSIDALSTMSKR